MSIFGSLIYVEGSDGAGKTTLINKLMKLYSGTRRIKSYSLPNQDCKYYQEIRSLLKSPIKKSDVLQTYMIMNMNELYHKLEKDLVEGIDVIVDRSWISTLVYNTVEKGTLVKKIAQKYEEDKTSIDFHYDMEDISINYLMTYVFPGPYPNACIFLDPPPTILEKNSEERIKEGTAEENDSNLEKIMNIWRCYHNFFSDLEEINRASFSISEFRHINDNQFSQPRFVNDINMQIMYIDGFRRFRGYTKDDPALNEYYQYAYNESVYSLDKLFKYLK